MPYIEKTDRKRYAKHIRALTEEIRDWSLHNFDAPTGQMNYIIHMMIKTWIDQFDRSYANYNEMIGMLECAKLELYRAQVGPYEDKAKKKALAEQSATLLTLRSEDACMHVTHAFVYYDQHNHKDCLAFLRKSLECDKRSSGAYRLWGTLINRARFII